MKGADLGFPLIHFGTSLAFTLSIIGSVIEEIAYVFLLPLPPWLLQQGLDESRADGPDALYHHLALVLYVRSSEALA